MDESIREQIEKVAKEIHKVWSTCGEHESSKFEVFCFLAKWHIQRTLEARLDEHGIYSSPSRKIELTDQLQQLKDG